jgi:hypothetical protein
MNTQFYVKYQNSIVVLIDVNFASGTRKRTKQLANIDDLIAAFQEKRGSLLANTDCRFIRIYSPAGEQILGNTPLANIEPQAGTFDQPLIIKTASDDLNGIYQN